jgi:hypothetical protein
VIDYLGVTTEDDLRKHVWYWALSVIALIIIVTVGIMWLRQGRSFGHWTFKAAEFGAIGTWFSGTAAAAALFSGAALVVNERRRQWVRDRLTEANEVRYHYREDPGPSWVVYNGSSRSITLLEADGRRRHRTVLPRGEFRLRNATMLARAGYRGDQPVGDLIFEDGAYQWTRADASISGQRLRRLR